MFDDANNSISELPRYIYIRYIYIYILDISKKKKEEN